MELTFFDFAIFGIIAFFALIGLMRGFVKEVFSIANWVIASIVTVLLRPVISNLILMKINIPILADLISNSFLFTTTLICVSIVTSNISKGIGNKVPSPINVTFGLLFGTLKGYILSALVFSIMLNVYGGEKNEPIWLVESSTYQPLSFGAEIIKPFTDSLFGSLSEDGREVEEEEVDEEEKESRRNKYNGISKLTGFMNKIVNGQKHIDRATEDLDAPESEDGKGYKKDQIRKMDRLIDTIRD